MWAHYADNHSGFVLEFDASQLVDGIDDAQLRDVEYKDAPDGRIEECLARSAATMKPRHAVWLQQAVLSQAYFSKQTTWAYEKEKRLVVNVEDVESINTNMILFVPVDSISSITVGSKATQNTRNLINSFADQKNLPIFNSKIGIASATPFFVDHSGDAFVFDGQGINPAKNTCSSCSEPIEETLELCAWCRITTGHEMVAARSNPFRILHHYGLLDNYLAEVENIERSKGK